MVTNKSEKSGNKKLIRGIEQDAWDNLTFKYGLEDSYLSDDFNSQNSLTYTWSNKRETELHLAKLDRAHVGEWAKARGGKVKIPEGFSTLSDHLPILLTIRKRNQEVVNDKRFRFNLSFLEEENLKQEIINKWNDKPRLETGTVG